MESLMDFLTFGLPAGFVGSVFTWFFGRRKRDNDMLSHLQASINMLSGENRKILDENIQLRRENADLKANQEEMILKLARLTREVELLRKVINRQTNKKTGNEKSNPRGNPHANANDNRTHPDGMCRGETIQSSSAVANPGGTDKRNRRRGGRTGLGADSADQVGGVPATDDGRTDTGGDSGVGDDGGCSLAEPP